jgi:hypothetical protein
MRIFRSGGIAPILGGPKSAKNNSRVVLRAATNFCLKTTSIENQQLQSGAPKINDSDPDGDGDGSLTTNEE